MRLQPAAIWLKFPAPRLRWFFPRALLVELRFGLAPWRSGSGLASRLAIGAMAAPIAVQWCAASAAASAAHPEKTLIISGGFLRKPWMVETGKEVDGQPFFPVGVNNYKLALFVAGRVNDPPPEAAS